MTRFSLAAAVCTLLALSGCVRASAPSELSGLWSAGDAACSAGVGVQFGGDAIAAVYERQRETLFSHPIYHVESSGDAFRVRIEYDLPTQAGGARSVGAHGVLVLVREGVGLAVASHNMLDPRTGSARVRIEGDPAVSILALKPCAAGHPWRLGLRGSTPDA